MKHITMTEEQTRRYDSDDISVFKELREQAKEIREAKETIEIYTADNILAEVIQD